MSVLSTSPNSIRVFDINIANALGSSEAATILQQLHYWMQKSGVGVVVNGVKYVYNTFRQWVREQFIYLTDSKFIRAMKMLRSLEIVKVIRHKAKQWNQTNYYSLDYQKLKEWAKAQSIEISELADNSPQDSDSQPLEISDFSSSYIDTKNTTKEKTTNSSAAFSPKNFETGTKFTKHKSDLANSSFFVGISNDMSNIKQNISKNKGFRKIEQIVNLRWKDQIKDLDSAGIRVNKTLIGLLKSYEYEQVENAISLFKTRKRSQYIPNSAGYFTEALKQDWASNEISLSSTLQVNSADLFRYWYDLARELGYCSGQEIRDEEQWVCVSGTWEKWSDAVERGYSFDYLKKIIKRNEGK